METKIKGSFMNADYECLRFKRITEINTEIGYLQLLEYILQDCSYLHIVQYHFSDILEKDSFLPNIECKSFYRDKDNALKYAHEIGNKLLQQYECRL